MSEIKSRADLFEAAAKMMRMCDDAGVKYAFKIDDEIYRVEPILNLTNNRYEFPLAIVEGKPVFKGDELFLPNGEKVVAGKDGTPISVIGASCSWLPPKPKTVMVEMSALSTFEQVELQEKLEQSSKDIERLNALVAMQAEALNEISGMSNVTATDKRFIHILQNLASEALSASSSTVAKWEAEMQAKWNEESNSLIGQQDIQIESLQRQVAMLHCVAGKYRSMQKQQVPDLERLCDFADELDEAISNTQATAEAYDREHAIKSAGEFKALLLESTKVFVHPHIEGVFAVYEERLRATKQVKE